MEQVFTQSTLKAQLTELGVEAGDVLLVHSAFGRLGHVAGGPQALIETLLQCLGPEGTLVMPAHTAGNTEPGNWQNPPVPPDSWARVREALPAFRADRSPSWRMGVVAETFRAWPGVLRSEHPVGSFCAFGSRAKEITAHTDLEDMFGETSPLARIVHLRGKVLLLGVGYDRCTMLHLAEHRSGANAERVNEGSAVWRDAKRTWIEYEIRAYSTDDFVECGAAYEALSRHRQQSVGSADARLLQSEDLVRFASDWFRLRRR